MSLLDSVRQTLENAAGAAMDVGQNLGAQAQAQLNLKKLQLEHAKKLHELGSETYAWHTAGKLVAAGAVPRTVHDICHALDDLNKQMNEQSLRLEEARLEADLRLRGIRTSETTITNPGTEAAPADVTAKNASVSKNTQTLESEMQANSYHSSDLTTNIPGGPDLNSPSIPVPGPDMPGTAPEAPGGPMSPLPTNPDMPERSQPTMPGISTPDIGIPGGPMMPPMPGSFPSM